MHVELALQQSPRTEQSAPSGTQPIVQRRLPSPSGAQRPWQHCALKAQGEPSLKHAEVGEQRFTPELVGSGEHGPVQHSLALAQASPSAPHDFSTQREIPSLSAAHAPEQQSASFVQVSQVGRHPPSGAQRRVPSDVG